MFNPKDRGVPIYQEIDSMLRVLSQQINQNPERARRALKFNNTERLKPIFRDGLEPEINRIAHLPRLFERIASPVNPAAKVLFLGSGGGVELIHARETFPQGQLFAIDKELSPAAVLSEVAADAQFHKIDLDTVSPEQVVEEMGMEPDIVIARHPHVDKSTWWKRLPEWAWYMQGRRGILAVTNFFEIEQAEIILSLMKSGIFPGTFDFSEGKIVNPQKSATGRFDEYVTMVNARIIPITSDSVK